MSDVKAYSFTPQSWVKVEDYAALRESHEALRAKLAEAKKERDYNAGYADGNGRALNEALVRITQLEVIARAAIEVSGRFGEREGRLLPLRDALKAAGYEP